MLLSGIFSSIFLSAQEINYTFTGKKDKISLPFEKINNLIVIRVTMNGFPIKLILDTGAGTTILTSKELCSMIGIPLNKPVKIPVIGQADSLDAYYVSGVKLEIGEISNHNSNLIIFKDDIINLSHFMGKEVHGILGIEIFREHQIRIDYHNKMITIAKIGALKIPKRFEPLEATMQSGRPVVNASITLPKNNQRINLNMLIDLGASHALLFDMKALETDILPEKNIPAVVGRGLGGDINGFIGNTPKFNLGTYDFNEVTTSFASNYTKIQFGITKRHGTIGGALLSRFSLIFDLPHNKLWIKPLHNINKPFYYNLSGMEVYAGGTGLMTFYIASVRKNSPADIAGIREGDLIYSLNGINFEILKLNDIIYTIHSRPGRKINIKVLRGDSILKKKIVLKDMLKE